MLKLLFVDIMKISYAYLNSSLLSPVIGILSFVLQIFSLFLQTGDCLFQFALGLGEGVDLVCGLGQVLLCLLFLLLGYLAKTLGLVKDK